jgi:hypothetical protein
MADDPKEIWLEPKADEYTGDYGRTWCDHNAWDDQAVRYILASEVTRRETIMKVNFTKSQKENRELQATNQNLLNAVQGFPAQLAAVVNELNQVKEALVAAKPSKKDKK